MVPRKISDPVVQPAVHDLRHRTDGVADAQRKRHLVQSPAAGKNPTGLRRES